MAEEMIIGAKGGLALDEGQAPMGRAAGRMVGGGAGLSTGLVKTPRPQGASNPHILADTRT